MTVVNADNLPSHAIIAGVNKCGTTSMFRYLSTHPQIRSSKIKEPGFFHDYVNRVDQQTYDRYRLLFDAMGNDGWIALEAGPDYFTSGRSLVERIHRIIPNAKFIVMLRDPVDRLHSYFRSARSYDNYATRLLKEYCFDRFVEEAISASAAGNSTTEKTAEFKRAIEQGNYAAHAATFHKVIDSKQAQYVFFDAFEDSERVVLTEICRFLSVADDVYESYEFTVENKSRAYRSQVLQRLAFRANMRAESLLNRFPRVRQLLRRLYLAANESSRISDGAVSTATRQRLLKFYAPDTRQLRSFLRDTYPTLRLPGWILGDAETKAAHGTSAAQARSG